MVAMVFLFCFLIELSLAFRTVLLAQLLERLRFSTIDFFSSHRSRTIVLRPSMVEKV